MLVDTHTRARTHAYAAQQCLHTAKEMRPSSSLGENKYQSHLGLERFKWLLYSKANEEHETQVPHSLEQEMDQLYYLSWVQQALD